jgi:hypothetical protein
VVCFVGGFRNGDMTCSLFLIIGYNGKAGEKVTKKLEIIVQQLKELGYPYTIQN